MIKKISYIADIILIICFLIFCLSIRNAFEKGINDTLNEIREKCITYLDYRNYFSLKFKGLFYGNSSCLNFTFHYTILP